ncbi:MAG: substrate-binding domain-containing protein [Spirochaetes bacterium]|jgi:LacI family transcriptional regulator|nr:substrate-binding domain-containing protein [Spirochaetota bacterium]
MAKKRVSAEDVAQEAGVSRTTVSFVVNNTPGKAISEETRRRVLDAAERLGYIPNEHARRLAFSRKRAIGLFIGHSQYVYTDAFISRVVEGMAQAMNRRRVQLIIHPVSLTESSYMRLAKRDQVEGIVFINTHDDDPAIAEVIEAGFPSVTLDPLGNREIDQVYVDNDTATEDVVRYLLDLNHRDIAMITHARTIYSASRIRLNAFRRVCSEAGIEVSERWVQYGDFSEHSGYLGMQDILASRPLPTAVFAGNDVVAYGAMRAINDAGLRIPDDISLCGFDDDYLSRYLNPPLTTMALPAAGMGSAAVSLLMSRLDGEEDVPFPSQVVLPAQLSIRNSCREL